MRLAEAFRAEGLDEHALAKNYAVAVNKLSGNTEESDTGSVEKLLLDTLKEWSRIIEPPRPVADRAAPDAPAVVQLIHRVPRPARQGASSHAGEGA